MNADIQRLANNLIYDGHLRCGSLEVANKRIRYQVEPRAAASEKWPSLQPSDSQASSKDVSWAISALDAQRGAVFVDTDLIPGFESRREGSDYVTNVVEIKVIKVLTSILQGCGVEGRQICILSPYRAQLTSLEVEYGIRADDESSTSWSPGNAPNDESSISDTAPPQAPLQNTKADPEDRLLQDGDGLKGYSGIEVHTIDRYQGRDSDIVIISFVRSNTSQAIGDLLRDWRRINVAITRARYKLIMVGSQKTLKRSPLFAAMLKTLNESDSVITIPALAPIPATVTTAASSKTQGNGHAMTTVTTAGGALLKKMHIAGNVIAEQQQ
ncbi:DNA replication endonuclease-helicase Dna2 [Coemansia sp. RSA 2559]|nr:DNA replication endonuclease-helicase Dna2 [Coemansia sp. RSA 2559]